MVAVVVVVAVPVALVVLVALLLEVPVVQVAQERLHHLLILEAVVVEAHYRGVVAALAAPALSFFVTPSTHLPKQLASLHSLAVPCGFVLLV